MTRSEAYRAPFGPGGDSGIDAAVCERLLAVALSRGGDYADLFFEYRAGGGFSYDEGILKAASRGVSMGLGVRVLRGDATGYAYTEDLTWESMSRAAQTAAQIATAGGGTDKVTLTVRRVPERYELGAVSLDTPGRDKRTLLERASAAAFAHDPHIVKAEASFAEEIREVLIATSDGVLAFDSQPLFRFGVRAIAERDGKRQEGSSGGGGRMTLAYFDDRSPEVHAKPRPPARPSSCSTRATPPPARWTSSSPPATAASCSTRPSATASRPTSTARARATTPARSATRSRATSARWSTTPRSSSRAAPSTSTTRATSPRAASSSRTARSSATCTIASREALQARPHRQRPPRELPLRPMPRMTNTVLLAGPHDPEEILKSVKRGVFAKKFGGGQVDIGNGDFVFSLTESYLIEDGKITAPLKGVNLIGNGPDVLRKVTMLGNDVEVSDGIWTCGKDGQSVPVGVGCPTIKIDKITVGGTKIG
jgi:TldD protein